jgi:hypothetical protein
VGAAYRFQQGLRALGAWFRPVDDDLARSYLTPPLAALYSSMRRSERQHSLRVLSDLLAQGHRDPDLLAAALLHDVGKTTVPFSIPEKVIVVLVKAFAPGLYRRWGSGSPRGWRRPFAVSVQHPEWGAALVAQAGGSARTVDLIQRHADSLPNSPTATDSDTERLLRVLQQVDDRN